MKKRILSLLCVLALCLGLLPVTALAAEGAPSSLCVGNQQVISSGGDTTYWTTDNNGSLSASSENENWTVKYDPNTVTLSLRNAKISGSYNQSYNPYTAGIYAYSDSGALSLNVEVTGSNTVSGDFGFYANSGAGAASVTIKGTGSLTAEKSTGGAGSGIIICSTYPGTANAELTITGVDVTATNTESSGQAIRLQPTEDASAALAVNGGSLTSSGATGIDYQFGTGSTGSGTPSLTVSDNAIVRVNGGINNRSTTDLQIGAGSSASGGIVFDDKNGTVYGSVTLQDDLTISEGESLTVPSGTSLDCNGKLTNNGTILANGGTVTGNQKNGTAVTTPSISVQPTDQTVNEGGTVAFSVTASNANTYQWQQSINGSDWADISQATSDSYTISSTTTGMSGNQYRCVVTGNGGVSVISQAATLTVTANTEPTTYTISTAEELRNFAAAVNEENTTINAVLTADITLTGGNWTPIGKDKDCMYNGTFDGQGHTISGLCCSVSSGDVAGLFGVIGSNGKVKNLGIADSDAAVSTTGQNAYAGGVCGYNGGAIENCWNSGSVTATANQAYAGGVCGENQGTIENCWNSGAVSTSGTTTIVGSVCGANDSGTITNCYWLEGTADYGIGSPRGNTNAQFKTTEQFASGEVAWLLNQGQTGNPWGQGSNNMPVLTGNLPAGVTSYVPVRIKIVMTDNSEQYHYSAAGSTFEAYPVGYAFVFKDGDTKTWINKGTQTYDSDATIYAENMTLEKIFGKDPTCTVDGHSAYWYCAAFDKYFSDENGVNEIAAEDTVIPATGHDLTKVAAKEPTSTQAGNIEYWHCSNCGKYFSDENGVKEITAEDTVIPATGHSSGGSSTPAKTTSQQVTDKIESAKDGDTVSVNLSTGTTKLDKEVFEELSGKDVTLEISVPGGVTWTVDGRDIPADADLADLNLGVTMNTGIIPVDLINTVTGETDAIQLSLQHDGAFGFTMTLTTPVGKECADLWVNLYRFDEDANELIFRTAARVDTDGTVSLPFEYAGQYVLVLDEKSHVLPFEDLADEAWYTDAVAYVYRHDLMAGYGDGLFGPDHNLSRAQLCQILYNMENQPSVNGGSSFTDVADSEWYADAVTWAASRGIVDGYGGGLFGSENHITREQLAVILYRYAQTRGDDVSIGEDTNILSYTDVPEISEYAIPAMQWACGAGILEGNAGHLYPRGDATRTETATMLMRFCTEYVTW